MEVKRLKITFKPTTYAIVLTMAIAVQASAQQASPYPKPLTTSAQQISLGAQRTTIARNLHVLSQSIPTTACFSYVGFRPHVGATALDRATETFDTMIADLQPRDASTAVTQEHLSNMRATFAPMRTALENIGTKPIDIFTLQVLADHNLELQELSEALVEIIADETAGRIARLRPDALAVDIAARQVLLTQRIAKDFCLVMADINPTRSIDALRRTIGIFEVSLHALQHGMQSIGMTRPPSQEISENLALVQFNWASIKGLIGIATNGGALSGAENEEVLEGLTTMLAEMNSIADLYVTVAQRS